MFYRKSKALELESGRKDEVVEEVLKDEQVMEDWAWIWIRMFQRGC